VTYLYAEQLIDQTVFLKWCLAFTEKTTIEVSPIVLILLGIFWDDLIARRSTGRKLTELLLDKADSVPLSPQQNN
jgi:mediator of RNA polymerase II transcription subunit 12